MNLNDENILNVYCYGSEVYNCKNVSSDNDYIIVISDDSVYPEQLKIDNNDYSIYSESKFRELIQRHEISVLECLFLDPKFIVKEIIKFNFTLDLN